MVTSVKNTKIEQEIIRILHRLPTEQASHLLSYAHFLELQTRQAIETEWQEAQDEESEQEIAASEEKWDELFARPEAKTLMEQMALEALAEEEKGLTIEMRFDKHDNLMATNETTVKVST